MNLHTVRTVCETSPRVMCFRTAIVNCTCIYDIGCISLLSDYVDYLLELLDCVKEQV